MSQRTQKQITDYVTALAEQKSMSKITVRDIVESCGITRNTFYYYFHDIYDVIEQMFNNKLKELEEIAGTDYEAAIYGFTEFCVTHKKLLRNVYKSVGHERFTKSISMQIHQVIINAIYIETNGYSMSLTDEDIKMIEIFYEEALLGLMLRWLNNREYDKTTEEIQTLLNRFRKLFKGQIALIAENSRKSN